MNEKYKKYYTIKKCKVCGIDSDKPFPYFTYGRCAPCMYAKNKEYLLSRKKLKPCKVCKKEFFQTNTMQGYCSNKCLGVVFKEKRKGKNNPAYRNGTRVAGKKQTPNKDHIFHKNSKIIRLEMKEKVGHIYCQVCNQTNSLQWETHHIIYRSEAPKHPNLHNPRNLILCCIKCHNAFHADKFSRTSLVHERKLWELFPEIISLINY